MAHHLVDNSRLGIHSHGLIRVPQYIAEIREGELDPRARPTLERAQGAVVWITGNNGFGAVGGTIAARQAITTARKHGIALVLATHLAHTGRLGAYAELIAASGCIATIYGSGPPRGHMVAPFGGIDGRLSTNPIAYALPNRQTPVVADFSTSALPEGKIRSARNLGRRLPAGVLQDPEGNPVDDPAVLYATPRGTLLPLGGPDFGHKGYALAILVEAMGTLLAGQETNDQDREDFNLAIVAIAAPRGFGPATQRMTTYLKSSRPRDPNRPVIVPGDPERIARENAFVEVDPPTWKAMKEIARELGVDLPPE